MIVTEAALNPAAWREVLREKTGGHAAEAAHAPHLAEALAWIARAQDATRCGGIARGYSLVKNPYFGLRGWEPAYPETTGYLIPTLYLAAWHLDRADLAARAGAAARWECDLQLPGGGVRGGVVGQQPVEPAVFNTGQVLLGWLAAYAETGAGLFAQAARRAGRWLALNLDRDGVWRRGNSRFADSSATLYNARVSWALAEAGCRLAVPEFTDAAARSLRHIAQRQRGNGWIPDCCLDQPQRPLLHTIAYAIRGLLEGGRVLQDSHFIDCAATAAEALAQQVGPDGRLAARFDAEWRPAADYCCLTGEAQMANVWMRLARITGGTCWLEPVSPVLQFLKSTQNRVSADPGLRGGIKGSFPVSGDYGRFETLSWATKFFADALMRHERLLAGTDAGDRDTFCLA